MSETEPEDMPKQADKQVAAEEETAYTLAEFQANAAAFEVEPWAVAGIFRESNTDQMTEAQFRAGLAKWRGEG